MSISDKKFRDVQEDLAEMEKSWLYTKKFLEGSAIGRAGHNLKATVLGLLSRWSAAEVRASVLAEARKRRNLNVEVVDIVLDHAINRPGDNFIATYPLDRVLALARGDT